ncbi:MAG: hypothetical protein WDZ27_00095 [Waddliaceae bacterium]
MQSVVSSIFPIYEESKGDDISGSLQSIDLNSEPNVVKSSRLYFFAKLAQTILLRPIATVATLTYRIIKLITWVSTKSAINKVLGYHTESYDYFEREYLKTVKAVRDILFIPSMAKRCYLDMVAKSESFADDMNRIDFKSYPKVHQITEFQQYSSYLHGCKTFKVIRPDIAELPATSDPSLKAIMASHLFEANMMAINFGSPNVATFVTEECEDGTVETVKVDAKSLHRAEMSYHSTNGKIQSGVFIVPTNLPTEALDRFKKAAKEMEGSSHITCVNTNCRVLKAAGISIEAVEMEDVILPSTLMEHLLFRNVIYTDLDGNKHKVHFDILNTTPHSLEEYLEIIDTAVVSTRLRHRRRSADNEENRKARGEMANELIAQEERRLSDVISNHEVMDRNFGKRKITVSVPSFFGDFIAGIWGRHTIFEVDLSDRQADISEAFQNLAQEEAKGDRFVKLKPFPQVKPSLGTRLKRDFFFSGPMIRFLRRHMMGRVDALNLHTQDLFNLLKSTNGERFNYALLDDKVVLARAQANTKSEETHRKVADWALSKHALLAGRQAVYCSGELWYDNTQNCFMFNNDSGTYEPGFERVEVVVKLANNIFSTQRFQVAEQNS